MDNHITPHKMRKYQAPPFLLAIISAIEKRFIGIMALHLYTYSAETLLNTLTIRPSGGAFWYIPSDTLEKMG